MGITRRAALAGGVSLLAAGQAEAASCGGALVLHACASFSPLALGPASTSAKQGIPDNFGVLSGSFSGSPVYSVLAKSGVKEGAGVSVASAFPWALLTPQSSGRYTHRVYSDAGLTTLVAESLPFTVAASALPSLPLTGGQKWVMFGDSTYQQTVAVGLLPLHTAMQFSGIGASSLVEAFPALDATYWPGFYPFPGDAQRQVEGWNEGSSGDTTNGFVSRLPRALLQRPSIVFVPVTVNDVANSVTQAQTIANFVTLINRFNLAGAFVVVTSMPPIPVAAVASCSVANRNARNQAVHDLCVGTTAGLNTVAGCQFVDLWTRWVDNGTGAGVTYGGQVNLLDYNRAVSTGGSPVAPQIMLPQGGTRTLAISDVTVGFHPARVGSQGSWGWAGPLVDLLTTGGVISATASAVWQSGDETAYGGSGNLAPYPLMGGTQTIGGSTGCSGLFCPAFNRHGAGYSAIRNVGAGTTMAGGIVSDTTYGAGGYAQTLTITPSGTETAQFGVYLERSASAPFNAVAATAPVRVFVDIEVTSDPDGCLHAASLVLGVPGTATVASDTYGTSGLAGTRLPVSSSNPRKIQAQVTAYYDGTGYPAPYLAITTIGNGTTNNPVVLTIRRVKFQVLPDFHAARGAPGKPSLTVTGGATVAGGISVRVALPVGGVAPTSVRLFLATGTTVRNYQFAAEITLKPADLVTGYVDTVLTGTTAWGTSTPFNPTTTPISAQTYNACAVAVINAGTMTAINTIGGSAVTGLESLPTAPVAVTVTA